MTDEARKSLVEKVARAICVLHGNDPDRMVYLSLHDTPQPCWRFYYGDMAQAAIATVLEEAAKMAEGPVYRTSGVTKEVSIRGGDDGNWSVPMPVSGFKGSDYGTGRYDAAAAIRALISPSGDATS